MNRADLTNKIARELRTSKAQAGRFIDALLRTMTKALAKGDTVTFVGFGTFKTAVRKARVARNPQTGARLKIKRRKAVRFAAGKALKSAVN
jgi:DNA-binding protein HU-beta